MPEKSWKVVERKIAQRLGGKRNPLSGADRNTGTRGDVIHPAFYTEIKHTKRASILTLHADTRKKGQEEKKIPITVVHGKGTRFDHSLVCLDLEDFEKLCLKHPEEGLF